jgi:hypothetical protein
MSSLVDQPYAKYWDGPLTRREAQRMINKLSANDSELMGMADTAALLINYILEVKFGFKDREEIDIYVAAKKLQLEEARARMKEEAEKAAQDTQADGVK